MQGRDFLSNAICPVCSSIQISFVREYHYHSSVFTDCSIVKCNTCEMVFVNPMPSEVALEKYNAAYFDNAHGGIQTNPLTIAFLSAINLLRVVYVQSFQQKHSIAINHILEIGPGGGQFAKHWLSQNPAVKYTVVESDKTCHTKLLNTGITVYSGINEVPATEKFDLVVISHVLEHTENPSGFVQHVTKQLCTGGILFIEVPCLDFMHKQGDEPHLLFFDKSPMQLFLTNMGFDSIQLSYHGNTIDDLKKRKSLFEKIESKIRNRLLSKGITAPFSGKQKGLDKMNNPMERAVIKPFKSHVEQDVPSWWLRAIAIKNK